MGNDDDRRAALRAIRQIARGQRRTEGRDQVPDGVRIEVSGGGGSRTLNAEVIATEDAAGQRRVILGAAQGQVSLAFRTKGDWIFSHGDLRVEVPDRACGAALVAAVARWLGTPLADSAPADMVGPVAAVEGSFTKLGVLRDADGIDWDRLKVFLGKDESDYAELFLGIAADGKRVSLSEKWSNYRRPLVGLLSRSLGDRRPPANRKVVTVGEGGVWFSVPPDWVVAPQQGHMRVTDARDDCCVEVSYMAVPRFIPGLPSLAERLRFVLAESGHPDAAERIVSHDRGDLDLVWVEYDFESDDTQQPGVRRLARARPLLAAGDHLQVLATFSCWIDDLPWAIPEWERIVDSLEVAGGPDLRPDMALSRQS